MSNIFYKFKSAKEYDTLAFDGSGISVFDLKKEIIEAKKLGKGLDFDLSIYHAQTNEDDAKVVPRNTQILVQRKPPSGKQGTAQKYVSGPMPTMAGGSRQVMNAPFQNNYMRHSFLDNTFRPLTIPVIQMRPGNTEDEELQTMFKQSDEYWQSQEKIMQQYAYQIHLLYASQRPVMRPRPVGVRPTTYQPREHQSFDDMPSRDPPSGYICYRCGQKGHFINMCPTHGDVEYDNRPRIRRTTGIPRSFLATIENADIQSTAMVSEDGAFVVARPNDYEWNKAAQSTTLTSLSNNAEIPDDLKCNLCIKLFVSPVSTPCCQATYCDACNQYHKLLILGIRHSLLEHDHQDMRLRCPGCKHKLFPGDLVHNKTVIEMIDSFIKAHSDSLRPVKNEQAVKREEGVKEEASIKPETDMKNINSQATKQGEPDLLYTPVPRPDINTLPPDQTQAEPRLKETHQRSSDTSQYQNRQYNHQPNSHQAPHPYQNRGNQYGQGSQHMNQHQYMNQNQQMNQQMFNSMMGMMPMMMNHPPAQHQSDQGRGSTNQSNRDREDDRESRRESKR